MSFRRSIRAIFVVLIVGLALLPTPSVAAPGASVTEVGWWSRNPFAQAPAGGFQVANAPDGPGTVAAVRVALEGRITKAILIINEAGGIPDAAAMRACTTTSTWSATGHAWANAPTASCTKAVRLTRNASAANWTGDITGLLPVGQPSVSIMIVPEDAAAARPAWQADFSLALVSAEAEPNAPSTTTTTAPKASGGQSSGGGTATTSPAPSSSSGSIGSGGGFVALPPSAPATPNFSAEPEPVENPGAVADPPPDTSNTLSGFTPAAARPGADQPWGRLFLFLPIAAAFGVALAVGQRRWNERTPV